MVTMPVAAAVAAKSQGGKSGKKAKGGGPKKQPNATKAQQEDHYQTVSESEKVPSRVGSIPEDSQSTSGDATEGATTSIPKQLLQVVVKKIKNLEKRKGKLENLRADMEDGKELNSDQLKAVESLSEVEAHLETFRETAKSMEQLVIDAERQLNKAKKREEGERRRAELGRLREVLMYQEMLNLLGREEVRHNFSTGAHGAPKLTEAELELLDRLYEHLAPSYEGEDEWTERLTIGADIAYHFVIASPKPVPFHQNTDYKSLKQLADRAFLSDYMQKLTSPTRVDSPHAKSDATSTMSSEEPGQIQHTNAQNAGAARNGVGDAAASRGDSQPRSATDSPLQFVGSGAGIQFIQEQQTASPLADNQSVMSGRSVAEEQAATNQQSVTTFQAIAHQAQTVNLPTNLPQTYHQQTAPAQYNEAAVGYGDAAVSIRGPPPPIPLPSESPVANAIAAAQQFSRTVAVPFQNSLYTSEAESLQTHSQQGAPGRDAPTENPQNQSVVYEQQRHGDVARSRDRTVYSAAAAGAKGDRRGREPTFDGDDTARSTAGLQSEFTTQPGQHQHRGGSRGGRGYRGGGGGRGSGGGYRGSGGGYRGHRGRGDGYRGQNTRGEHNAYAKGGGYRGGRGGGDGAGGAHRGQAQPPRA